MQDGVALLRRRGEKQTTPPRPPPHSATTKRDASEKWMATGQRGWGVEGVMRTEQDRVGLKGGRGGGGVGEMIFNYNKSQNQSLLSLLP